MKELPKKSQYSSTQVGHTKREADPAPDANFPKDAVNEWLAPKQIRSFYFVRFQSYEDPTLKTKIELAVKEVQQKNQARFQLTEALKEKKIGVYLDGVSKEQQVVEKKIKHLKEEMKPIDHEISSLQEKLIALNLKKDKTYDTLRELMKVRDEGNTFYYQNWTLLKNAKDLAAKKDIAALEELSHIEVEKFMVLRSSNKAFRDDYEKKDIAITGQLTIE